jgi:hypothetical protein
MEVDVAQSGYGLDGREAVVRVPPQSRIFVNNGSEVRPVFMSNGHCCLFPPEVKRSGRLADNLPPTSVEVKKTLIYAFTLPYVFFYLI